MINVLLIQLKMTEKADSIEMMMVMDESQTGQTKIYKTG